MATPPEKDTSKVAYPTAPVGDTSNGTLSEADRALAEMGYAPVFKREFSMWSCFSFALSVSGLFATVMTTFSFPIAAGGGAAAIWCWLIAGAGALCLALSISEIVSAYPTSGGLYFTIKYLAPAKHIPIVAWIDGWLNLIGQIAGSASSEYGAAQMLLAAVSLGTYDEVAMTYSYTPTSQHIVGTMAALVVFHACINSLSTAWLNHLTKTYAVFHIAVLIAACVGLLVMTKDKHTAEYAFTYVDPEPLSGWTPPGFSFLFGFLSVAWTMTDYDATAHIAEEAKNPATIVPRAISIALTFTYIVGWLFNIVLVFCMGDPATIIDSAIGQPVVEIFHQSMGTRAAIFFAVAAFLIMNFVCITALQAGSRTIWAFSRDEMLPGSRVWYRVWSKTSTPVPAVWFYSLLCILINLIGLGSYITIEAVFNICAICLDWSYCIPIICKLFYGKFERGPWHLGKVGPYVNAWACIWTAFVSVIFLFPTAMPVAPDNMNYAIVIIGFVFFLATGYWFVAGRKYYVGPRAKAHIINGDIIEEPASVGVPDQEKVVATGRQI